MLHIRNLFTPCKIRSGNVIERRTQKCLALALCLPFVFIAGTTYGQNLPKVIPSTPASAQYEKYINYPVNHSTGAANIEIPVHTVKTQKGIQIPISFSYHTGGVKPSDPDLPVGLGWVVTPGARVTRKVVGYPDEQYDKVYLADFPAQAEDLTYLQNLEYSEVPIPSSGRDNTYDSEFDIFTYQTGTGVSGRFAIVKEGSDYIAKPLELTRHKIKLHYITNFGVRSFDYIEITDDNGTLYRFGKAMSTYSGTNTVEFSNSGPMTGWLLTDIVSADKKETITLRWQTIKNDGSNLYKQTGIQDAIVVTDKWYPYQPTSADATFLQIGYSTNSNGVASSTPTISYNTMSVIAGIKYGDEEVKLNYSTSWPTALNNIEVYNGIQKLKQVTLHKSTFTSSAVRLDSLSFTDSGNQMISRYRFGYESAQWATAPTRSIDFWGYYNAEPNASLIPNFSYLIEEIDAFHPILNQTLTSANRNSNANAKACLLNSVTYPTGGKTTYEYEVNQIFDAGLNQVFSAGGLRVAKIKHWTASGSLAETRTFKYGINESGSGDGVPMTADLFVTATLENSKFHLGTPSGGTTFGSVSFRKRIFTGNASSAVYNYDFPAVTYRQVTEYIGETSVNAGKIVYTYSPAQYNINRLPFSQVSYASVDRYWDRPRLAKTTYYKYDQGIYAKVSSDSTSYQVVEVDTLKSWLVRRYANFYTYYITGTLPNEASDFEREFYFYFPSSVPGVFDTSPIALYRSMIAPDTETHVEYLPSGNITTAKTYGYSNNNLLYTRSVTNQESRGDTKITTFTYPIDYSSTLPYTRMIDSNIVAPVIEQSEYKNSVSTGNFLQSTKTDYSFWNSSGQPTSSATDAIYPKLVSSSKTTTGYEPRMEYLNYDTKGNIASMHKASAPATSYIWGYNMQYPIAQAINSSANNIFHENFEEGAGNSTLNDARTGHYSKTNAYSKSLTGLDAGKYILSYWKKTGGVWALSSGTVTVSGGTYSISIPVSSGELIDDVCFYPETAQMSTYTYDPLIGTTSATDPRGETTYYEYDDYQRLMNVKDKDRNIIKHHDYHNKN